MKQEQALIESQAEVLDYESESLRSEMNAFDQAKSTGIYRQSSQKNIIGDNMTSLVQDGGKLKPVGMPAIKTLTPQVNQLKTKHSAYQPRNGGYRSSKLLPKPTGVLSSNLQYQSQNRIIVKENANGTSDVVKIAKPGNKLKLNPRIVDKRGGHRGIQSQLELQSLQTKPMTTKKKHMSIGSQLDDSRNEKGLISINTSDAQQRQIDIAQSQYMPTGIAKKSKDVLLGVDNQISFTSDKRQYEEN